VTTKRFLCGACGNKTRFNVVETTTVRSFHHFSLGGELTIEEADVLEERVDEVSCRWCGHGRDVREIDPSEANDE
jgi:Zn ribbon nucleic-acid-binding protein